MDNFYYDNTQLLSYNKIFNFVIGNRGGGKTFNAKKWAISDFIKRKKQFVWVRRYKNELKKINQFYADIAFMFPDNKLEVKGKVAYIDGEAAGFFINLSTASQDKSVSFPSVNKIIFDEFIIDKGAIRYLPNEVECFLELFETVARMRDDVRALFIANAISIVNPYFLYFKLMPKKDQRITRNEHIAIELVANQDYIDEKNKTRFGQLIKGTEYGNYAVENEFLRDNETFIEQKPPTASYRYCIKYKGAFYGLWYDINNGAIYVNTQINREFGPTYAITKDDHELNTLLLKNQANTLALRQLKQAFELGAIRYNSQTTKNQFYEIIGILAIK